MQTATELPIDRLRALRVIGPNATSAKPLANERVIACERDDSGTYRVIFQTSTSRRCITLTPRPCPSCDRHRFFIAHDDNHAFCVADTVRANRKVPTESRTGGADAGLDRTIMRELPARIITRTVPEITEIPTKLPLEVSALVRKLQSLDVSNHTWLYERLVSDHGLALAGPAFVAAYSTLMGAS